MNANAEAMAAGCIVCIDPLVTIFKRETDYPMGLAAGRPDIFADKPALHLVGLTWTCESTAAVDEIARDLAVAERALPRGKLVLIANTPMESLLLSREGIANVLANELTFVDERLFRVMPHQEPTTTRFDAIYVARLEPRKRHELAAAIPRLVLTHAKPRPSDAEYVRRLLPKARFANFEVKDGAYAHLSDDEIVDLMNRSAVGLCLSAIEGSMRVSLEYRLCGTPVVSTRSVGGRERYFLGPHVRVVKDCPDAVAAAVHELKSRRFERRAVREFVGRLVAFDRHNFLLSLNKIVERELGARDCFRSFEPFFRYPVTWRPLDRILAPIVG